MAALDGCYAIFDRRAAAKRCLPRGVDGIIVSNHGSRNMDSAAATSHVLPEIADAVGAKALLTGRATLYGTAVGGQDGAAKMIGILKTEMDKTMAYTGCNIVDERSPLKQEAF